MATRRDYVVIQTALGDALFQVRRMRGDRTQGQIAFWLTADTVGDYLQENNKAFDRDLFKQQIIETASVGAGVALIEERKDP